MLTDELHQLLEQECDRLGVNEVARRLGLDSGQVSRLRRKQRGFGPESIDRLGKYLDLILVRRNESGGAAEFQERLGEKDSRRAIRLLDELHEALSLNLDKVQELRRLLGH